MSIKKLALVAAVGLSMASAPVMAQTSGVERASVTMEQANDQGRGQGQGRGRGPVDGDEGAFGGTTTYVIGFFVIIVIALGIYFATDKDDDGQTSP